MPLPPVPRGNSVDTPQPAAQNDAPIDAQNNAQPDARPAPQIQTPAAQPIHHPGQTAVAPHPPSDIPPSPLRALSVLCGEVSSPPHPTFQSTPPGLTESAALELAKLESQLHALASPDGFAPTRDEFALAVRTTSRPYNKFFKGYDQFIRACGYKSASDRRREIAANQRAAKWAAHSHSHSEAPSLRERVGGRESLAPQSPGDQTPPSSHSALANPHSEIDDPEVQIPTPRTSALSAPSAFSRSSLHSAFRNPPSNSLSSCPSSLRGELSFPPIRTPKSALRHPKPRTNEPFYGDPIHCCDMAHAPVNEQGVVLLFGMLARKLGFRIEMVRTGYPDCEAKRKGPDDKWRRVRIEFEFLSSRFNHDPAHCDLIVCWEDDANPTNLEVLELKNHVGTDPAPTPRPAPQPTTSEP